MPIIYRPDPIGDALANILTSRSERDARQHNEEVARRHRQQRNTAIGVGAGLGAIGGLALGGATLASGGTLGIPALATATIPTAAILPGLTGAALGGQIGGQLAAEDYVGALGTAAGTAKLGVDYADNQRRYGFQPTREDMAAMSAMAARAGTTVGELGKLADQTGTTIAQQLGYARQAEMGRDVDEAYYMRRATELAANDVAVGRVLGLDDTFAGMQDFETVPLESEISDAHQQFQVSKDKLGAFYRTNGVAGRPPSEIVSRIDALRAKAGAKGLRRKPPSLPRYDASGKQVGEMTPGLYEGDDGITTAVTMNKDGTFDVKWKTGNPKLPAENVPPIIMAAGPEAVKQYQREASHHVLRARGVPEHMLDKFFIGKDGNPEQIKDDKDEKEPDYYKIIADIRKDLTYKDANGDIVDPSDERVRKAFDQQDKLARRAKAAAEGVDRVAAERTATEPFLKEIRQMWRGPKSPQAFADLVMRIEAKHGDDDEDVPRELWTALQELAVVFKSNRGPGQGGD